MNAIMSVFNTVLTVIYSATGNLGLTIIAFTILMRLILLPLTIPSIKAQKAIQQLQPEISKLKKKHGKDNKAMQAAQMELYKKYNVNPLAGCLPQILQIGVLILLYNALNHFLNIGQIDGQALNTSFLWLNLSIPDATYAVPILAGVTQFILSLMLLPATEVRDVVPNNSKNKNVKQENEKEQDMAEMAATMQQQMLFIMPIMTGIFALRFPAGMGLYWIITTLVSIIQQFVLSGPGGLATYAQRAHLLVRRLTNT